MRGRRLPSSPTFSMQKLKDNVRLIAWLSIWMSLAGAVISLRYLSPASSFSLEQFAYFFAINRGFGLIEGGDVPLIKQTGLMEGRSSRAGMKSPTRRFASTASPTTSR